MAPTAKPQRKRGKKTGRTKDGEELRSVYLLPAEGEAIDEIAEGMRSNRAKYCREAILERLQRDRVQRGLPPLEIPDLPPPSGPEADYGAVWSKHQKVRQLSADLVNAIVEAVAESDAKKPDP